MFRKLFPVILTDNGSEFSNPKAIEYGQKNIPDSELGYFTAMQGVLIKKVPLKSIMN